MGLLRVRRMFEQVFTAFFYVSLIVHTFEGHTSTWRSSKRFIALCSVFEPNLQYSLVKVRNLLFVNCEISDGVLLSFRCL